MLTLLGSLLGFIGSIFPDLLKIFQDKYDRAHELEIMDRQIKLMKQGHTQQLEEIKLLTESMEMQALYTQAKPIGIKWVDGLSGTVRPLITYAFFILYCAVKWSQFAVILHVTESSTWSEALIRIWHGEDQALFATVMSFWFGQRALYKFKGNSR
jgi:hypothetical protein